MLSKMQIEMYIKGGGVHCPYCESENLSAGDTQIDEAGARQKVYCYECGKTWTDIYELKTIEEIVSVVETARNMGLL